MIVNGLIKAGYVLLVSLSSCIILIVWTTWGISCQCSISVPFESFRKRGFCYCFVVSIIVRFVSKVVEYLPFHTNFAFQFHNFHFFFFFFFALKLDYNKLTLHNHMLMLFSWSKTFETLVKCIGFAFFPSVESFRTFRWNIQLHFLRNYRKGKTLLQRY